jgi:hypothetical protein
MWLVSSAPGQKTEAPSEPAPSGDQELDMRYAQAYMRLMEATLAKYEEMNRRQPNLVRPAVIQAIQQGIARARDRVAWSQGDHATRSGIYTTRAEAELQLAEDGLRKAEAVNQQRAGTIAAGEVERLRAQRDFCRIKLEKTRRLASESPAANARFELDQLREDVQDLRLQVDLLRAGRG